MIAIRKNSTTKLIKGARYEIQTLWNSPNSSNWRRERVKIVGMGTYSVKGFTDINGNPLPKVYYQNPNYQEREYLEGKDISDGDILVCMTDNYKNLSKGSMYKVEKVYKKEYNAKNFQTGNNYQRVEYYIKLEISKRKIRFWGWNFRKLTTSEIRDININNILGENNSKIVTDQNLKKIDLVQNKEKTMIEFLAKTILDSKRHELSPIDWCCQKVAKNWELKPEDFKDILNLKVEELLKRI